MLGIAAVIRPSTLAAEVLTRDYPVMIGLAIILFAMAYGFRGPGHINRIEGTVLLAVFAGYQVWLFVGS